jgi:hypothetical protein
LSFEGFCYCPAGCRKKHTGLLVSPNSRFSRRQSDLKAALRNLDVRLAEQHRTSSRHFKVSDSCLTQRASVLPLQPISQHPFPNPFVPVRHSLKQAVFSQAERLCVQQPLFVPIIIHFKFRMCVGSEIPISHSHKQMMTRLPPL